MANIHDVRIVADVPFNLFDGGNGSLSEKDTTMLASWLMAPATGLDYTWAFVGDEPNTHGGVTAMYRIEISGQEAIRVSTLRAIALALAHCGPFAKLHIAEARDLEFSPNERWGHVVPASELSGEATRGTR